MTARDDQGNGLHSGRDRRGRVYWACSHGLTGAASVSNPGVQAGAGPAGNDEATPPLYPQWRHSASLPAPRDGPTTIRPGDRKSTRLNSSHVAISYAVFCLQNKTVNYTTPLSTDA